MTKELTEQLRNGTLEEDFYYVKNKDYLGVEIDYYYVLHSGIKYWSGCEDEDVEEVLAEVPSYSEHQTLKDNCELTHTRLKGAHQKITQLEKKLDIATKALQYYAEGTLGSSVAQKALKEMEEV